MLPSLSLTHQNPSSYVAIQRCFSLGLNATMHRLHKFIRNGVSYECHAHVVSRPLGSARIYEWFVRANGKDVHCFRFTGREFETAFTTQEFEDQIVVCVVASDLPETDVIDADAILKAEALTPGRFVLHRDGRAGTVQELDVTRKFVSFEYQSERERCTEWVSIDDLVVSGYRATDSEQDIVIGQSTLDAQ